MELGTRVCDLCHGVGLVHTRDKQRIERLYACYCESGRAYRDPIYTQSDKNKERPFKLPVYRKKKIETSPYKD